MTDFSGDIEEMVHPKTGELVKVKKDRHGVYRDLKGRIIPGQASANTGKLPKKRKVRLNPDRQLPTDKEREKFQDDALEYLKFLLKTSKDRKEMMQLAFKLSDFQQAKPKQVDLESKKAVSEDYVVKIVGRDGKMVDVNRIRNAEKRVREQIQFKNAQRIQMEDLENGLDNKDTSENS